MSSIKNVIFDIGNVLVRWSPADIIKLTFGDSADTEKLINQIFQHKLWLDFNRGDFSEAETKLEYQRQLGLDASTVESLFANLRKSLTLVLGTAELLKDVKKAGYKTYALTDNVVEIVQYLQERYTFWEDFLGAIVSAEVRCLKPEAEIYNHLLNTYNLKAEESVFIDDVLANVDGAKKLGFSAIHFKNSTQCIEELKQLGLKF